MGIPGTHRWKVAFGYLPDRCFALVVVAVVVLAVSDDPFLAHL
jgi:hypothetical protein